MNILITGATGFIGFHVAHHLLGNGSYKIITTVRRSSSNEKVDSLKVRGAIVEEGSFIDENFLRNIFRKHSIDYVLHIGGIRGSNVGTKEEYDSINTRGTENLLELSLGEGAKRFIYCSSVGVWGVIPKRIPPDENTELIGDNYYHLSKINAEKRVFEYIKKGLDGIIVRPTITYGIGDTGFPSILVHLVKKRWLLLPSKDIRIHLLDVAKLSQFFAAAIEMDHPEKKLFVVADRAPISLKELSDLIYNYLYKKSYPKYLRLPNRIYKSAALLFVLLGNNKWLTRMLLMSNEWFYNISDAVNILDFEPADTHIRFLEAMDFYAHTS